MAARHGTANRYNQGCRCDAGKDSHRLRAADYRQRSAAGGTVRPPVAVVSSSTAGHTAGVSEPSGPGPVEVGVQAEIGAAAEARPGLAAVALALARVMDDPKAVNQQPAAAKVLVTVLDQLGKGSVRRGGGVV
jgi:hypothetical protein